MKRALTLVAACGVLGAGLAAPAPAEKWHHLDLQPRANQKRSDNLGTGREGNTLAALPGGEQTFAGVKFRVGEGLIQLGSKVLDRMPERVEGIQADRACARLHILHATGFGGGPNVEGSDWHVKDGTPIGEFRVNYEGGGAKVELRRAGADGEAFLSALPHQHTLGVTNPHGNTLRILLSTGRSRFTLRA